MLDLFHVEPYGELRGARIAGNTTRETQLRAEAELSRLKADGWRCDASLGHIVPIPPLPPGSDPPSKRWGVLILSFASSEGLRACLVQDDESVRELGAGQHGGYLDPQVEHRLAYLRSHGKE